MNGMRSGWIVAASALVVAVAACNGKGREGGYSNAADSGMVAPAARIDTSLTRDRPDSTTGGPDRTGTRGSAGDTLSTRGRPVGTGVRQPDSTRKRP